MSTDVHRLAAQIASGSTVAVPVDYAGVSMAMTRALIEIGTSDLTLICVPTGGMQADMLIGTGQVRAVETSAVSLGEAGGAPRFNAAVREGSVALRDATCPAILAGLMAAQKGVPFMPMRGLIGSDLLRNRPDWTVIDNPTSETPDPIVLIPAIHPVTAIFHAPMADREGNVWIGRRRELASMAYAARQTLVTVERIVDKRLLDDETLAAGTLPGLYVTDIAIAEKGAWPYGLWGEYPTDQEEIARYAKAARSDDGFADYIRANKAEVMA